MARSTAYRISSAAWAGCSVRDLEFASVCAIGDGALSPAWHLGPSSLTAVDRATSQYVAHLDRSDIADLFSCSSAGDSLRRYSPHAVRHPGARRYWRLRSSKALALARRAT